MLVKGARCAFQFYPSSPEQAEMITNAAMKNGFTGGMIVDFPNSKKAKKFFLFLMAGYSDEIAKDAERAIMMPSAKVDGDGYSDEESEEDESSASVEGPKIGVAGKKTAKVISKKRKANGNRKTKEWILKKKERQRRQGHTVKADSKYSGRRRPVAYS